MKQVISKIKSFALVNLSALFLLCSFLVVGTSVNAVCDISGEVTIGDGAKCAQGKGTASDISGNNGIFRTVANILLFIVGAVAVIMLIIGGLRYVTSNGDQNAVTGAKNTIMYAIIGIVVAFLAFAAVNFVIDQLGKGSGAQVGS